MKKGHLNVLRHLVAQMIKLIIS